MPVLTCALVLIFGGLTLWLSNENFIKIKPTILYSMFAAVLVGGLAFNRLFIKYLLGQTMNLSDPAWRALTWRWSVFFLALAIVNEFVWRNTIDGHMGRIQSVGRVSADIAVRPVANAVHRAPSDRGRQVATRGLRGATNRSPSRDGTATLLRRLCNFSARTPFK